MWTPKKRMEMRCRFDENLFIFFSAAFAGENGRERGGRGGHFPRSRFTRVRISDGGDVALEMAKGLGAVTVGRRRKLPPTLQRLCLSPSIFFLRPSFSVWLLFPVRNGVFVFRNYQSNSEPLIDKDFYLKQKKEIGHVDGFFFNRIFTSTRMPSVTDECDIRPRETASASFVLDGRSFSPRFNRPITEFLRRNSVRRPFFFQSNIHLLVSMNSSRQTRYTFLHSFDTYRKRHQVVVVFFNAISVDESDSLFSVSYWILRWNSVKKSEQTNATLWYGRNTSPTVRTNESRQLHWAFEEAPMNSNDKKPRLLASYRVLPSFSGFAFERWWRNSRSSTKTPIFRFLSLLSIRQP